MLTIVIIFLWASMLLYLLLGGADFGAGILELLSPARERPLTRQLTTKAIGPIWEANHMWLIITVVILFVGFPAIYTTASIFLHIPLLILLLGIVARGAALSFRSNDAIRDRLQQVYTRVFVGASVVAPFFLGIIAGSLLGGYINPAAVSFREAYLDSWLHWFPLALGVFTECTCAWLASFYLISRSDNPADKRLFTHHAIVAHLFLPVTALLVVLAGYVDQIPPTQWLFSTLAGRLAIGGTAIIYVIIGWLLLRQNTWLLSGLAVIMITLLYLSVTINLFPNIVLLRTGTPLSLASAANQHSIPGLGWALLTGSLLIFPSLFYLVRIFESRTKTTNV